MRMNNYIVKGMIYHKGRLPKARYFSLLISAHTSLGAMIKSVRKITDTYEQLFDNGYKIKFADLEKLGRCED